MKVVLIIQSKEIADRIEQGLGLAGLTLVNTGGAYTVQEIPDHLRLGKGQHEFTRITPDSGLPLPRVSELVGSTDTGETSRGLSWGAALPTF